MTAKRTPAGMRTAKALLAVCAVAAVGLAPQPGAAKEYILTAAKPNTLVLADPEKREVVRTYPIPGDGSPLSVAPSPDNKVAYVLTNHWGSISGIDLDSGDEVFRADFSTEDTRVRGMFAIAVSPDGEEIYSTQLPVEMGLGEYTVGAPYVAVYRTADGVGAKPVRKIEVPRRTVLIFLSDDGSKLYAVSWDVHVYDTQTGEEIGVHKVYNWDRENYYPPDVFGVWVQHEQAKSFVNPYFALRSDMSPENPDAWKTGMLTIDMKTGEFEMADFESTSAIIFSAVRNPVRRNEVYGVYTQLSKIDTDKNELAGRVELDHTYYAINVSGDGSEVYVAGTMDDIGVYDSESLDKLGEIELPSGNDMGTAWIRMIER